MIFRQLFETSSSTYTYLLLCARTKQAVLIDPVLQTLQRDKELLRGLVLCYGINTHVHADHVTSTGEMKRTGDFPELKTVISKASKARADILLLHGDKVQFGYEGKHELEVRETPGHTNGCMTLVCHAQRFALTGDAVLIGGCGRTDFQEGDARTLYRSVHEHIFSLPYDYRLYPAHDYHGRTVTTVGDEATNNPRLSRSEDEFVELMHNLNLPYPKQIEKAVPANLVCGVYDLMDAELQAKVFPSK